VALLAADTPRQVANAHTMFNIFITLAFLPFAGQFARFCEWVVPLKEATVEEKAKARFKAQYLDDLLIETPPLALSMVRRETTRMAHVVEGMLTEIHEAMMNGNVDKASAIRETDDQVDALYADIHQYLIQVGRRNLMDEEADEAMAFVTIASELENIADIVETPLFHLTRMCESNHITFSDKERKVMVEFHEKLLSAFRSAVVAIEHDRKKAAELTIEMSAEIVDAIDELVEARQSKMMREDHTAGEMAAFTLQTDIFENFKRIYDHVSRIAKLAARRKDGKALVVVQ
jgi:phosphate:Na+ symporter